MSAQATADSKAKKTDPKGKVTAEIDGANAKAGTAKKVAAFEKAKNTPRKRAQMAVANSERAAAKKVADADKMTEAVQAVAAIKRAEADEKVALKANLKAEARGAQAMLGTQWLRKHQNTTHKCPTGYLAYEEGMSWSGGGMQ